MPVVLEDALLLCFDGSAMIKDLDKYLEKNARSFVRKICNEAQVGCNRRYERGPGGDSYTLGVVRSKITIRSLADIGVAAAAAFWATHPKGRVFLTGWSRGGAACIQIAHDLKFRMPQRQIDAMFLFDAVDNDNSTGAFGGGTNLNVIPSNVLACYHAIADIKQAGGIDSVMFPTSGRMAESGKTKLVLHRFAVSHSGVGGIPGLTFDESAVLGAGGLAASFADQLTGGALGANARIKQETQSRLAQDIRASESVRAWMWAHLQSHRLL